MSEFDRGYYDCKEGLPHDAKGHLDYINGYALRYEEEAEREGSRTLDELVTLERNAYVECDEE